MTTSERSSSSSNSTSSAPASSARSSVRFWLQASSVIPKAAPILATCLPRFPRPRMPSVPPRRPCPSATCQPPSRMARSSRVICRASARIRAHVSSDVPKPSEPVPETIAPSSRAASTSMAAFWLPVVISSSSFGSFSSRSRWNGVRSRIATDDLELAQPLRDRLDVGEVVPENTCTYRPPPGGWTSRPSPARRSGSRPGPLREPSEPPRDPRLPARFQL